MTHRKTCGDCGQPSTIARCSVCDYRICGYCQPAHSEDHKPIPMTTTPAVQYQMRSDIKESLDAYWWSGRPTGDFLKAVLSNDLFDAVGRADDNNLRDLKQIVSYIYCELPQNCHGSKDNVRYWIESFRSKPKEGEPHAIGPESAEEAPPRAQAEGEAEGASR